MVYCLVCYWLYDGIDGVYKMIKEVDDDAFVNEPMLRRVQRGTQVSLKNEVWEGLFDADKLTPEDKIHYTKLYKLTKHSKPAEKAVQLVALIEDDPKLALQFIFEYIETLERSMSNDGKNKGND